MKILDYKIGTHFISNGGVEYVLMPSFNNFNNSSEFSLSRLNGDGWLNVTDFDDKLCMTDEDNMINVSLFDIIKIVQPRYNGTILLPYKNHKNDFKVVWERPLKLRMTKTEIEKALGYDIEIIESED